MVTPISTVQTLIGVLPITGLQTCANLVFFLECARRPLTNQVPCLCIL